MAPSADEILERMARAYASCSSYRDLGEVRSTTYWGKPSPPSQNVRPFRMLFSRPAFLRYDISIQFFPGTPEHRSVTWADGRSVRRWDNSSGNIAASPSILEALGFGYSNGSAHLIASLLLGARTHRMLPGSASASVREEDAADGSRYILTGISGWEEIEIDASSFLIQTVRSIDTSDPAEQEEPEVPAWMEYRERSLPSGDLTRDPSMKRRHISRSELTVAHHPEVDVEIPPEAFAFTPPA